MQAPSDPHTPDAGRSLPASSLAQDLFREIRPEFLRLLGGPNAGVYLDVLDALDAECSERNDELGREEALSIIAEVLSNHPDFQPEPGAEPADSPAPESLPVREKARSVLDYIGRCGWVGAETGADWKRTVQMDAHGALLLAALRKIARPEAAVFTDKLVGVCAALANQAELARQPWEHLQACRDNTRQGLGELRAMQKSVERFIRRQAEARTLGENLNVVFDQYTEEVGRTCYAELVRSQLAGRLGEARDRVAALLTDSDILRRMQTEVLRRDPGLEASGAMARVRTAVDDLARAIDSVLPLADGIDARTAEFARRSVSRFRYLQEVVGERRNQVKALFERLNTAFAGRRFADLVEAPELPSPLLPEARLLAGRDSLYAPARARAIEENAPIDDEPTDAMRLRARLQVENALKDSLTVGRANLFVDRLPGGRGSRIGSGDLPIRHEDDVSDLIAVLLHAESSEARYVVEAPHGDDPVESDALAGCRIQRFYLTKK